MNKGFNDTLLAGLPDLFYAQAKGENPFRCSKKTRKEYLKAHGAHSTYKLCDLDQYVYYKATDRALLDFVVACRTCTHVLVTNGDNGYAPSFLTTTLRQAADFSIVGFLHGAKPVAPKPELGSVDLGAVMMRKHVLDEGDRVFLNSLPRGARAREVHDADYWYVKNAIDRGATYALLSDEILMYHH